MYHIFFQAIMSIPVFVMVKRGPRIVLPKTVITSSKDRSFYELAETLASKYCHFNPDDINIVSLSAVSSTQGPPEQVNVSNDNLSLPISTGLDIGLSMVIYSLTESIIPGDGQFSLHDAKEKKNAFSLMMEVQYAVPSKCSVAITASDKMYYVLIDWVGGMGALWRVESLDSGEKLVRSLRNSLWYIESAHDKLEKQGCVIPQCFKKFGQIRDWKQMKQKPPHLEARRLNELINDLATSLTLPSSNSKKVAPIIKPMENLLECLIKYRKHLDQDAIKHAEKRTIEAAKEDSSVNDTSTKNIAPTLHVSSEYLDLDSALRSKAHFEYLNLEPFCPDDRLDRRVFINSLRLSVPILLYRVAYGGALGTHNFVWSVPDNDDNFEKNMKVIAVITSSLPKYSHRAAKKQFIDRYAKHVNVPKTMLRSMFYELTGCVPSPESSKQALIDERTAEFLFNSDDPDLILDYREKNGVKNETKFEEFYKGVENYFEKQLLAVQERRHDEQLYLPLAISMEDLKKEVAKDLPVDTSIPSTETLRLQFHPANPHRKESIRYTGRFNVRYTVQTRMSRVTHPYAKYVATQWKYLKQFCVTNKEDVRLFCLDDKAIVPVGEPNHPVSTGVRAHNRVLAPIDMPIQALDHDFHIAGLVPSVALSCNIPNNPDDSFFSGQAYVTTKDKMFQHSTPMRHAAELIEVIRKDFSEDGIALDRPVLAIFTDGGPDHRPTFETVKLSLLCLFMQLDVDMVIALRTAPYNSWMNLAERVMPVLNLALQHCALKREAMSDDNEKKMKNKSSLSAVRNWASEDPEFKIAFSKSMEAVIETVNSRFERMELKGNALKASKGQSDEDIEELLQPIKLMTECDTLTARSSSKDVRAQKELMHFMTTHSKSTSYCFQIMRCRSNECRYCTFLPRRTQKVFHFLPDPVPATDSDHTYKSFELVQLKLVFTSSINMFLL